MGPRELFRAMKADKNNLPLLGQSGRTLGARPGAPPDGDIPILENGLVEPSSGGMSVAPDDPNHLPDHRRPASLKGNGRDPVFKIQVELLTKSLKVRQDKPTHAMIEPTSECLFDFYQSEIHSTQSDWILCYV
jgi:hypothetical protein